MHIDIVTTATLRPDIIEKTYKSFSRNLFTNNNSYRVILNVDPIGEKSKSQEDVLNVVKRYFSDILYNFPEIPCFTKSVRWLWGHTSSDYVFHLEDDWILRSNVDINYMISILDKYPRICSVRLSKGKIVAAKHVINPISCPYIRKEDEGKFALFPRLSLNPTLFRGEFVRSASIVMTDFLNPESQLVKNFAKNHELKTKENYNSDKIEDLLSRWDHSVLIDKGAPIIQDIGTAWRRSKGINRKYDFMFWG